MRKFSYILVDHPRAFGSFQGFADVLRRVKDLGYYGIEFNLTQPEGFDVDELLKLTAAIKLRVVSFLTGANYFADGLCMSSPNDEVRKRAVERLTHCASVAARFGAVMVVGQMQGFLSDEPDRALGEKRIADCMKRVTEAAERYGTTIAFEPVNHLQAGFNNSLADVMALADRIRSPFFKPMLDTFHMNIEETSMTEPVLRVGKDLGHFHLCESNGSVLGSGHLDFKQILQTLDAIGYDGYVSFKVYREPWAVGAETSLAHLKQIGAI